MSMLGRAVSLMYAKLSRDDYPRHGICSHFGVTVGHPCLAINMADRNGMTLVTLYARGSFSEKPGRAYLKVPGREIFQVGFPACVHKMRAHSVAEALDCGIVETWNGGDGHSGISVVLDREPPDSLVVGIRNYRGLPSPFNLREEDKAGFSAFHDWLASEPLAA